MPERLSDINLLPEYERRSERSFHLFILFLMITVLSFILLGVFYFITKDKLATAESDYEQLSNEAEILQAELNQLEIGEGPELVDAVAFVEQQNITTSALITHLDNLLPAHSYLSNYEYGTQITSIYGQFESLNSVASYTTNLTESDYIVDTKVNDISTVSTEEDSDEISYYEARFTLGINKQMLKKEMEDNE